MQAEQQGPAWDAVRHAQTMAATYNAAGAKHKDGRPFGAEDFMRDNPWQAAPRRAAMTPQQLAAMHKAWLAQYGG